MKQFGFVFFIVFVFQPLLRAQDFTASVSKSVVASGERFRLSYVVRNKNMEGLTLPKMTDFSVVGGPYQSSSTQIINGNVSSSVSVSYDLVCTKPGSYILGGATLKSGGKTFTSNEVEIQITKEKAPQNQQNRPAQDPFNPFGQPEPKQQNRPTDRKNDLFVVTQLSKNSAYPGEAVTVTYKIYTRFQQIQLEEIKFPEYTNAWVNELKESGDKSFSRETYNGQTYNVAVLQKTLFIPQKPGDISIKPVTARVLVQYQERSGNFWDDFFGGGSVRQERREVSGNPVTLKVEDYPEKNRPLSFSGATGDFTMSVTADRTTLPVNDALTLLIKLSGKGNFSLLDVPRLNLPDAFESYEPKINEKVTPKSDGISGYKTFELVLVPRNPGVYQIPPVEFSYFNPATGSFKTLFSDTLKVEVTGDAAGGMVYDPGTGGGTQSLAEDIRYLKTTVSSPSGFFASFPGVFFWLMFVLLFLGTLLMWFFRTRIWDRRNDFAGSVFRKAESVAVKRFKKAGQLLTQGDKNAFYEECYHALSHYLRDRYQIPLSEISSSRILPMALERKWSEGLVSELAGLLETCEMARFAPGGSPSELSDFHKRCIHLIAQLENKS
jgi:hypothetical protein